MPPLKGVLKESANTLDLKGEAFADLNGQKYICNVTAHIQHSHANFF